MSHVDYKVIIQFHPEVLSEDRDDTIASLMSEFGSVAQFRHEDPWKNHVSYDVKFNDAECSCHSILSWALIGFFMDRWTEVKDVAIEVDGKRTQIFPRDFGTCS